MTRCPKDEKERDSPYCLPCLSIPCHPTVRLSSPLSPYRSPLSTTSVKFPLLLSVCLSTRPFHHSSVPSILLLSLPPLLPSASVYLCPCHPAVHPPASITPPSILLPSHPPLFSLSPAAWVSPLPALFSLPSIATPAAAAATHGVQPHPSFHATYSCRCHTLMPRPDLRFL